MKLPDPEKAWCATTPEARKQWESFLAEVNSAGIHEEIRLEFTEIVRNYRVVISEFAFTGVTQYDAVAKARLFVQGVKVGRMIEIERAIEASMNHPSYSQVEDTDGT